MRIIHYTRVSTDDQAAHGTSLESQTARLRADSEQRGDTIVAEETDPGKSAKNLRRPGLQSALARLRSGEADGLKITKLDRLTRSVDDWCKLRAELWGRGNNHLVSLGESIDLDSPHGRFLALMQIALGELEREQTGERVTTVSQDRKKRGLRYCRRVYGLKAVSIDSGGRQDFRFHPCPDEQRTIQRMYTEFTRGRSLGEIASRLNRDGIPGPNGGKWYPATISRILERHEESLGV